MRFAAVYIVLVSSLTACSDDAGGELPIPSDAGERVECDVPSEPAALIAYLRTGDYKTLPSESKPHASAGPHGGKVRTFLNQTLFDSLEAGSAVHPVCSTAVKELYGDGEDVIGYAVYVKVRENAGGAGYYWYETFDTDPSGEPDYEGDGERVCVGCHSSGVDFVRTPFPLQ